MAVARVIARVRLFNPRDPSRRLDDLELYGVFLSLGPSEVNTMSQASISSPPMIRSMPSLRSSATSKTARRTDALILVHGRLLADSLPLAISPRARPSLDSP